MNMNKKVDSLLVKDYSILIIGDRPTKVQASLAIPGGEALAGQTPRGGGPMRANYRPIPGYRRHGVLQALELLPTRCAS